MGPVPGLEGPPVAQVPQAATVFSYLKSRLDRLASLEPSGEGEDYAQQVGKDRYGHSPIFAIIGLIVAIYFGLKPGK